MSFHPLFRSLRASRGYSVMAMVTLAIGLAAVGITFAVVDTVLLRPLPFAKSDRIVTISQKVPFLGSEPTVVTADEFLAWQKSGLFESTALIDTAEYTLEGKGHPERIYGASVTPEFFKVFGLQAMLGRGMGIEDAAQGRDNVIVLSHELWARRFGSDRAVIGRTMLLSGSPMVVIGVMPPGFDFPRLADLSSIMNWAPEQSEFWVPFVITPKLLEQGNFNYYVLGKLGEGVTRERAAEQFRASAVHLFKEKEIKYPQYRDVIEQMLGVLVIYVTPLREAMAWGIRDVLWMLLAAVALLLVLVLFNLGNLLLTRNAQRLREYTVRQALGASRWQLFRQSFLEQTALVGAASALALLLMAWGIEIIRNVGANRLPRLYELQLNFTHVAALAAMAFATAIIFGALSQLVLSDAALNSSLQSQGRTSTGDRRTNQLKSTLMAAEIAVSVVLLVGAGLLLESFAKVMHENPGFNPNNVLTVKVSFDAMRTGKPAERLQHVRELLNRFRSLPGVQSASIINRLPLTGDNEIHDVRVLGKPMQKLPENLSAEYRVIDAAYFRTMQIPLIAGRDFRPDDPGAFAVINRRMATRLWPGEDPIDKQFADGDNPPVKVIGVVGDVHNASLEKPVMMQFYRLISASPYYSDTFVIRSAVNPESLIPLVQRAVWQLDASEPVTHPQTMDRLLASVTLQRRFETGLLTGFAVIALFLSGLGLFGVASLSVARRTREFGIRLALGATGPQILTLELGRTGAVVMAGLAAGLLLTLVLARTVAGLLYGVTAWNTQIYFLAVLVLAGAALLAAWLPARRAARIDPASALRSE